MTITIPCPHCGEPITLDVDLTHHLPPATDWTDRIQERGKEPPE